MNSDADPEPASAGQSRVAENILPDEQLRFFHAADWLSFWVTAFLAFAIYLFTLAPEVTLGFSGIFSVGAKYAGVPHPPGYPVYTLYGWLFTKLLPFSNIAWRLAVGSAVAASVTCGLIALMISRGGALILEGMREWKQLKPGEEKAVRIISGFVAGMAFGFSGGFWGRAVIADPWSLSLMLLCLTICLVLKWFFAPEQKRFLYLAFFIFGLTFTNSQMLLTAGLGLQLLVLFGNPNLGRDIFIGNCLLALILGALDVGNWIGWPFRDHIFGHDLQRLYFLLTAISLAFCIGASWKTGHWLTEWKTVLVSGSMFLLGTAAYLYVPVASMTNPPINWGYPRTVEGFIHVLTRGQYERIHPTDSVGRLWEQIGFYSDIAAREFGLIYLVLALVPICMLHRMARRERSWILALYAAYISFPLLLVLLLNPTLALGSREAWKVFFSATYVVLALLTGYGITLLVFRLAPGQASSAQINDAATI